MTEPARRRVHPAIRGFVWFGVLSIPVLAILIPGLSTRRVSNDRSASAYLKTIASAQADFRGNDRDENKIQEYWRADVAGLYTLEPSGPGSAIKLIDLSIAGADVAPVGNVVAYTRRAPKAGYWYKVLRYADEDPTKLDPQRFAACAFPASSSAGKSAFIVSHLGVVYRRSWKRPSDTPSVFPPDPAREGWTVVD